MPWGRIDDTLYDHPKVVRLGRDTLPAIGLYTLAISWSNRHLTDGLVPADQVRRLGGTARLADDLVKVGLWDHENGSYRIHDYLDHNKSRDEVGRDREQRVEAGMKSGLARGRRSSGGSGGTGGATGNGAGPADSEASKPGTRTERTANDPFNESANDPFNESANDPFNESANDSFNESANDSFSKPATTRSTRTQRTVNDSLPPPTPPPSTQARPSPIPSESLSETPSPRSIQRFTQRSSLVGDARSLGEPLEKEPRLTKDQLDAWATFNDPAWHPFKASWLGHGFRWPPQGSGDDDEETSLRSRLWEIADARPNDLGRWVAEAKATSVYGVLQHVFGRWVGLQDEVGGAFDDEEGEWGHVKSADRVAALAAGPVLGGLMTKWLAENRPGESLPSAPSPKPPVAPDGPGLVRESVEERIARLEKTLLDPLRSEELRALAAKELERLDRVH